MAAPTIVQHKSGFATAVASGGSITVSFTSNVTANNMILALCSAAHDSSGNAVTINTPTMTGETFTAWSGAANAGSTGKGQTAVYAVNSAAGGHTGVSFTITIAGGGGTSSDVHLHIIEINGQAGSPRDASGNTESATLSVSTSGATTTANDLVIGWFYDDASNVTFTAGSGYAQVEQTNNSTGGDAGLSESKTVSSTGVQTATASGNGTDTCEQSIVAVAGTSSTGVFEDDTFNVNILMSAPSDVSVWGEACR